MKTLIAATAAVLLVTASSHARLFHLHWEVPAGAGEFVFTVDSAAQVLTWDTSRLWVSGDAGRNAAIWGPPTLIGGQVLPGYALLRTHFSWPDGTSTMWQFLQYRPDPANPGSGRFEAASAGPALPVTLTLYETEMLTGSLGRFTVDPERDDVLEGPILHAPEPAAYGVLAGLGLLGLGVYRRRASTVSA